MLQLFVFGDHWRLLAALFFWRPATDVFMGPQAVQGELVLDSQEDIYIMRTSHALDHNIIYVAIILSEDGKDAYTVRMTPTQFERWDAAQMACENPTYSVLKYLREILKVSCPAI
ncbi:hypothetical protein A2348_04640 [Candidatus Uhrbacteria bacterium RIFOXYB12_FULL_58_10]|uniref:Uncharacterized protein n=1 Tax=Candidatus Uhrbacteria bacterium RIFOXYB2_FULL_57_15 TaxID=1802422 RepID=A0A1F7W7U7_9BACT|nr:MAG: hypothetical protein A2348_04640 [Candidatus Uhrbacteria bacterium RIFOXYB12_FULL_58_10]OGL98277.1 MAG: hypothetical protein A2304_00300 [Candidatus Uhrbacteria bacterium RIFOXYB2_FULL_57_15]OGL98965.1 MAG: hypothetical protein A2501_02450 [Candidatus Uhrbacteria bacterium RIFOXYC12_FULL_57_11]